MNLHQLLPHLHQLSYADKLLVMQFLEAEIAREQEEEATAETTGASCPAWHRPDRREEESWFQTQEPGSLRSASDAWAAARSLLQQRKAATLGDAASDDALSSTEAEEH